MCMKLHGKILIVVLVLIWLAIKMYFCKIFQGCYADYISVDEEVTQLIEQITKLVNENADEAKVTCLILIQFFWPNLQIKYYIYF